MVMSLLARSLDMILYLKLRREMGLNWNKDPRAASFGPWNKLIFVQLFEHISLLLNKSRVAAYSLPIALIEYSLISFPH